MATESGPGCTVNVVVPEIEPCVADMVLVPVATPVASPLALIVVTAVLEEAQVTWLVMFCVLLSEYVPVAVNCCVASRLDCRICGSDGDRGQCRRGTRVEYHVNPVVRGIKV